MDEYSKYLTWVRSKKMQGNSWESQAFGHDDHHQDHAGSPFGGLVWPPRSYSCGFCNRQFRSAQALGGHMNVHRRDRARLKQDQHQDQPASAPTRDHNPHHNNNNNIINCNSSSYVNVVANPTSNSTISPSSSSNSSSRSEEGYCDDEKGNYMRRGRKKKREKDVNLCIGLSLGTGDRDLIGSGCKRMKVSTTAHVIPTLPFFLHPSSRSSSATHDEATIRINAGSSMEDLDLELRLGSLY